MSEHTICDMCKRIIYKHKEYSSHPELAHLEIEVDNRYGSGVVKYSLDLCEGCDMKLAKALYPVLPSVAVHIEPNVTVRGIADA